MHSIQSHLRRGVVPALFLLVNLSTASAQPAVVPNQPGLEPDSIRQRARDAAAATVTLMQFSIDPGSIRQRDRDKDTAVATVTLKVPSPTFFVCQIRSSDGYKIGFPNIIFKKGEIQGTAQGTVYWLHILKDCSIKLSAFNVDDPDEKLWYTVELKVKDANEDEDNENDRDKLGPANEPHL